MTETEQFVFHSHFPCSVEDLYSWHARQGALERLIPPWENTTVLRKKGGLDPGGEVEMRMHAGVLPFTWVAHHVENQPVTMFRDIQYKGPFSYWSHTHIFTSLNDGADGTDSAGLEDRIEYALPLHSWLPAAIKNHVRRTLQRTFEHRRRVLEADLRLHAGCCQKHMRVLISGASGVLGRALRPLLTTGGHEVFSLVRRVPDRDNNELYWNPETGEIDDLPAFDAVIHLAGEYIGLGRWNAEKKKRVVQSRTLGTGLLAEKIASQPDPPKVFLCASAVGFYGDTEAAEVDESAGAGNGFISEVCARWENAAAPAQRAGIRTVFMRIGIALAPNGGALKRLLGASPLLLRRFGSGRQYISWISLNDTISAIYHAMCCTTLEGPVNMAAPNPVTNAAFIQILSRITGRPLAFPVPARLLKAIYGQMATEILLSGCRTDCRKLQESGFVFRHEHLEDALTDMLGKFPSNDLTEKR